MSGAVGREPSPPVEVKIVVVGELPLPGLAEQSARRS